VVVSIGPKIAAAIRGFNEFADGGRIPKPDVLIVARGGGSLEDLWCFNEEIVVRAAAASMIPLISAVGHETDITLIDFAADRRAPTPTAAAEMAVPVRAELVSQVAALGARKIACWQRGIEIRKRELRSLARALPTPDRLLADRRQHLDNLSERLPRALRANAHVHHQQLSRIAGRLTPQLLRTRIERCHVFLDSFFTRGQRAYATYLARRNDRVRSAEQLLRAFSYRGVLNRGFALIRNPKGIPLRAAASVDPGMRLVIEFSDGRVGATADGAGVPAPSKPKSKTRGPGQGSLF
jgi:exodeoxyribonuclease VII large subunit